MAWLVRPDSALHIPDPSVGTGLKSRQTKARGSIRKICQEMTWRQYSTPGVSLQGAAPTWTTPCTPLTHTPCPTLLLDSVLQSCHYNKCKLAQSSVVVCSSPTHLATKECWIHSSTPATNNESDSPSLLGQWSPSLCIHLHNLGSLHPPLLSQAVRHISAKTCCLPRVHHHSHLTQQQQWHYGTGLAAHIRNLNVQTRRWPRQGSLCPDAPRMR